MAAASFARDDVLDVGDDEAIDEAVDGAASISMGFEDDGGEAAARPGSSIDDPRVLEAWLVVGTTAASDELNASMLLVVEVSAIVGDDATEVLLSLTKDGEGSEEGFRDDSGAGDIGVSAEDEDAECDIEGEGLSLGDDDMLD